MTEQLRYLPMRNGNTWQPTAEHKYQSSFIFDKLKNSPSIDQDENR